MNTRVMCWWQPRFGCARSGSAPVILSGSSEVLEFERMHSRHRLWRGSLHRTIPGQNERRETMAIPLEEWEITCDKETFAKVRQEEKFAYIVALARAVNALYAVHSLLPQQPQTETPERVRNGMNSYFFASALLYEGLSLIRKMNKPFADDS